MEEVGSPLISTTLIPEGEDAPLNDAQEILALAHQLAAVVDGGPCPLQATTRVIDLTSATPEVLVIIR